MISCAQRTPKNEYKIQESETVDLRMILKDKYINITSSDSSFWEEEILSNKYNDER